MKRKTNAAPPPLQEVAYDTLPESVKRKYFSSFERLQIQQQAAGDQASEPSSGSSSRATSTTPFRRLHSRRRARTVGVQQQSRFTQAEAAFFLSLPDKVRKQHFSREEQVILFAKCDQAFHPSNHDLDAEEVAKQRFHDFHFDFPANKPTNVPDASEPRGRRSSISAYSPSRPSFGFSPNSRKERDAESSVFFIDAMDSPSIRKTRQAAFRRTMSLSGPPSRHSTCSASAGPASPLFVFPAEYRPRHQRSQSSALPLRRSSYTPMTPTFDAEAKYYQDPETRTKLRMYLASPQKFDEAIEFGFPTAEQEIAAPHYQLPPVTKHSRKFSRDMHTFLRDGKLSFFEDRTNDNQGLESDGESIADVESPTTPSSAAGLSFRLHSRQMSSIDFNGLPSSHSSPGHVNREMTLRMTLTRPELRADEDALYGWQSQTQHQHQHQKTSVTATVQDDPLALEELILTDDQTGTKGPFYVKPKPRGNLVTRLLKRTSLKGRA